MTGRPWRCWWALVLGLPGCIGYLRFQVEEPVPTAATAALVPGLDLGACLGQLGAPHRVLEQGSGMALVWAWYDTDDWSFDVQFALQNDVSASFEFDLTDTAGSGLVVWFDADWRLVRWRTGRLAELLPTRSRPAAVDPGD